MRKAEVFLSANALFLSACGAQVSAKQAALDKISDKCGLPKTALQAKGEEIVFAPSPDTKYEVVDCALIAMRDHPDIKTKLGFVGNERYDPEMDPNAQKN